MQILRASKALLLILVVGVGCTRSNPSSVSSTRADESQSRSLDSAVEEPTKESSEGELQPEASVVAGGLCVTFKQATPLGRVQSEGLTEISGVVASRRHRDILWVHNDSGGAASVSALTLSGALLGEYRLKNVRALDWEDLAIGSGDTRDVLYVGDIGDNLRQRANIIIYRFDEPVPQTSGEPAASEEIDEFATFRCVYPEGGHFDSETLLVDPTTDDLYLITKDRSGLSHLFKAPATLRENQLNRLELVSTIQVPGIVPMATGGDVSPQGDGILVRTYTGLFLWTRAPGTLFALAFDANPLVITPPNEQQGESIGYAADGMGFYTISEGLRPEVNFAACNDRE